MSRIAQQNAKRFMLAGNAWIQFWNTETDNRFRFIIREKKEEVYYVYLDAGKLKKEYIGHLSHEEFKTPIQPNDPKHQAVQSFAWMWRAIRELKVPDTIHIQHMGRCGKCGRPLTDAESIELGIGPVCGGRK